MKSKNELLRTLPKIDEVLQEQCLESYLDEMPRSIIVDVIRESIDKIRNDIISNDSMFVYKDLLDEIVNKLNSNKEKNIKRLINGTGTVIHTNLGRSMLSFDAAKSAFNAATNYTNLEYDIGKGKRGLRHDHIEKVLKKVTGAEAAIVVNNNAAATMLTLSALGYSKEVIVSRGELVEIGGSFRIPDIMNQSGATLIEVGTTNKTKLSDYKYAINENTAALLKVHTSNYEIVGFTEDVNLNDLVKLGQEENLPVIYDLGSGLIYDLNEYGIHEPSLIGSLKTGIDIALFSGDKLLGGPQCGIIVGNAKYIDMFKKHPLARVLRVDKMTLSALEVTLMPYLDKDYALNTIPTLKMVTADKKSLFKRANLLNEYLPNCVSEIVPIKDQIGGGAAPTTYLDGYGVSISHEKYSIVKLERMMRKNSPPIIARLNKDKLIVSLRTISDEDVLDISNFFKGIENE
ncbi:MAG TPA: L-seryl-tRNA(Sec) selenium transferase [Anaerovoracaceae bacterium]|nr:L-seryl-tRNA(Sec) selenium transferase [Anaerovoracaceae bacterium]